MPAVAISGCGTAQLGPGQWVTDETEQDMKTKINACFPAQPEFCKLPPPPWQRSATSVAGSGGAGVRALGRVLRGGAASFATGVLSGAARGRDMRAPPPLACGRYGVGNL